MANPILTKEEYVKMKEENINRNIKVARIFKYVVFYPLLASSAVAILLKYTDGKNFDLAYFAADFLYLCPLIGLGAVSIYGNNEVSKDINKWKATKVEMPSDEELAEYNSRVVPVEEAPKLKIKKRKIRI